MAPTRRGVERLSHNFTYFLVYFTVSLINSSICDRGNGLLSLVSYRNVNCLLCMAHMSCSYTACLKARYHCETRAAAFTGILRPFKTIRFKIIDISSKVQKLSKTKVVNIGVGIRYTKLNELASNEH